MPSITTPSLIPEVLCGYLNIPLDTLMPRSSILAMLYNKCKTDNLTDPNNRRNIIPNERLREIFYMEPDELAISFNTFQYYSK